MRLLESGEDVFLHQPLHRDDEGKAEFLGVGRVQPGEARMLFGGEPVEPGRRLLGLSKSAVSSPATASLPARSG